MRRVSLTGLVALAAVAVAGCGGSHPKPSSALLTFPGLGYKPYPPHVARAVPSDAVLVVDQANAGRVAPAGLRFASDGQIGDVRWSGWGDRVTTGLGTATVRICTPDCGAGRSVRYPARMVLSGIQTCDGRRYYKRASVTLQTVKGPRPWGAFIHAPCT